MAGTVVRWRVKAGSQGGAVKLRVLRPAGTSFTAVASSAVMTVTSDLNTFTTSLPIQAGDVVAMDNDSSGLYFTNSPAVTLPLLKWFQPAIPDGMTGAPNNQQTNVELLMNADVTPAVAGAPPPGAAPAPAPAISKLSVKPRSFRAARSGASVARKRPPVGATVGYTLSTDATVGIAVQRAKQGRRRGGRCHKPNRSRRGRRCTRYVKVKGSFNVGGTAGANKFKFRGRIGDRRLGRGGYRLVATPATGAKAGQAARARFRIR